MTERRIRRSTAKNPADRLENPLISTLTTTGGGKSFFLQELAALHPHDLKLCEDQETRDVLWNSVAVTITYNDASPFNEYLDDNHPQAELALRALHRY